MATVIKRKWTYNGTQKTAGDVIYQHDCSHKQATYEKKKECDAFIYREKRGIEENVQIPARTKRTVREIGDLYLNSLEEKRKNDGMSRNNVYRVHNVLNKFTYPLLGNKLFA